MKKSSSSGYDCVRRLLPPHSRTTPARVSYSTAIRRSCAHLKYSPTPSDSLRVYAGSPLAAEPFPRGTPTMFRTSIIAVVVTLYCFCNSYAQLTQQQPNETALALEVVFQKGRPPAYQPVAGSRSKTGGSWYGLFGRIAGWQLPQGTLPINAVTLVPYLKGETINISVSVMRGTFHHAKAPFKLAFPLKRRQYLTTVTAVNLLFKPTPLRSRTLDSKFPELPGEWDDRLPASASQPIV